MRRTSPFLRHREPDAHVACWHQTDSWGRLTMSAPEGIVLQKSKVAAVRIFGENLKRKEVNDSHTLGRATEVTHEFGARR
jgi:hypothetical protein